MNDRFQRESIGDGVWFSSVTDPKFKHNRISANLLVGLESETASVNAALPFILRRGCRSCPDFTMLNQKLCELYGASLSCDVSKFGGYQVLELSIYGIDDRFTLDNAPLARECAALLCDVLLDPKLSDGAFDEQDTALERQQLVDTIEGQINDKRLYALTRCKSLMCAGEPIAVDKYGSIPDAKAITAARRRRPTAASSKRRRWSSSSWAAATRPRRRRPSARRFPESAAALPRSKRSKRPCAPTGSASRPTRWTSRSPSW